MVAPLGYLGDVDLSNGVNIGIQWTRDALSALYAVQEIRTFSPATGSVGYSIFNCRYFVDPGGRKTENDCAPQKDNYRIRRKCSVVEPSYRKLSPSHPPAILLTIVAAWTAGCSPRQLADLWSR